MKTNWTL